MIAQVEVISNSIIVSTMSTLSAGETVPSGVSAKVLVEGTTIDEAGNPIFYTSTVSASSGSAAAASVRGQSLDCLLHEGKSN